MPPQVYTKGKALDGGQYEVFRDIKAPGRVMYGGDGKPISRYMSELFTNFPRPVAAAVAVGTDLDLITLSTGTVQLATTPTAGGGVNVKTRSASAGTDGDIAGLKPALTTNAFNVPLAARCPFRFETRIALTTITKIIASAGMDSNITRYDPAGTAGEGAGFLICDDPTQLAAVLSTTALLVAGAANTGAPGLLMVPAGDTPSLVPSSPYTRILCWQKISGADTVIATAVAYQAATDYELAVEWGQDLKPRYYINGVLVATGGANTAGTLSAMIGVEIGGDATSDTVKERDIDIRYVSVSRANG